MFHVLVCDDDPLTAKAMESMILNIPVPKTIYVLCSLYDVKEYVAKNKPDIIICDIVMGEENAIPIIKELQVDYPGFKVIFFSGFANLHFERVYQVQHEYLLAKPVKFELLTAAFEKAARSIEEERRNTVLIKGKRQLFSLRRSDVFFCEIHGKTRWIRTNTQSIETTHRLDELEDLLDEGFARCHYSILVNLACVASYHTDCVKLINDETLPVSAKFRTSFKEKLLRYHEDGLK